MQPNEIVVEVIQPCRVTQGVEIQPGARLVIFKGLGLTLQARGLVKEVAAKKRRAPKASEEQPAE